MTIQVLVNEHNDIGKVIGRKVILADEIKSNKKTVLVRLKGGKYITRRINRDIDLI